MIGKVIKNNYKLMDEIGQGSVATVYLAKDARHNRVVALKIIRPDRAAEGQFLPRFRREAKLLQMLTSPQAVKVFDYGEDQGLNFIVLEYVQGKTLEGILEEEGPLEVNRALDIARQVALCLVDAHAKSIVHRDIRPANIMVTGEEVVKVMDFGIAWGAELSRLTATGVLGSPHYLSPEQAGGEEVDGRSDIYSLGVTLFEMLSGRKPYDAASAVEVVLAHLQEPVPSLRQLDEKIPPQVDDLVKRCLAKEPGDRYQSAAEFLEAVDGALRALAREKRAAMGMETALAGQTLGPYRIVEQVGRGGMATVYKAYEPALDRYVAVKVLPQYFAHDPDFAARFEREAKAVAKLDHPNILPIYSFGQEAGLTYIAMRYVETGTLKEMLGQPLDLHTTANIFGQIGQALDYAHRQGVVHRDVKPSNVLMSGRNWALLTDFGLARMVEASVQLTKTGVGVGTPAYMSPEQGQGIRVDARSDVYSLGVVLYEMVTGKVPYEAETPMAVVLKHITAPLPLPREANPQLPESVERVILKAMAKAPEDRYQTVGEMVEALERAVAGVSPEVKPLPPERVPTAVIEELATAPEVTAPVAAPPVAKKGLPGWAWGVAGVVVLLIVAGAIFLATQGQKPSPTPTATEPPAATPTVTAAIAATPVSPAQPEGKIVEQCAGMTPPQICVRDAETDQVTQVTDSLEFGSIGLYTWSPDGQQIIFSAGSDPEVTQQHDHKLYIINADGSGLRRVTSGDTNDVDPAWSPDGQWIAFHRSCSLCLVRPDGSDVRRLLKESDEFCAMAMAWSPDSQQIVFLNAPAEKAFPEIWVVNRDGTEPRVVYSFEQPSEWVETAWSPDGLQIACWYDEGGRAKALLINADGSGEPQFIERDEEMPWSWRNNFWPPWGGEESLTAVSTSTPAPPTPAPAQPEGKIVEQCAGPPPPQICVRDAQTDQLTEVTDSLEFEAIGHPVWSPDGQQIIFSAGSASFMPGRKLYVVNADGSGLRQVTSGDANDIAPSWSPDGQWIVFHRNGNLGIMRPDGSEAHNIYLGSDKRCADGPEWAPDSQRIAFVLDDCGESNPHEVWTINRDGSGVAKLVSAEIDWQLAWSPDGRQVAYSSGERWYLVSADGGGEPQPLSDRPDTWLPNFWPPWGGEASALPVAASPVAAAPTPTPVPPTATPAPPTPTPAPLTPTPMPAFLVESCENLRPGLCIYPLQGGAPTKILEDTDLNLHDWPSWSPDGQRIAFSALKPGESEDRDTNIYIVNPDGSGLTELPSISNDLSPAWSPDGQWLAFHSGCGLAVMRPDGSDQVVVLRSWGNICVQSVEWSPDSQWFVVSTQMGGEWALPMTREVQVISRDGATVTTVATITHETDRCIVIDEIAFSPNGTQVAYTDADCKSWVVNADGSGQAEPLDSFPVWWTSQVYPQWGK
jgi:serine/threonine protein kinase/Tol biopolymer transport system component